MNAPREDDEVSVLEEAMQEILELEQETAWKFFWVEITSSCPIDRVLFNVANTDFWSDKSRCQSPKRRELDLVLGAIQSELGGFHGVLLQPNAFQ
mmetsp:Transcript_22527/g.47450  ORF Transcript_22527/g.47450 Transcript_22527/m.47450 type:complete len:95 (-) Transcript_22527:34-318(-)